MASFRKQLYIFNHSLFVKAAVIGFGLGRLVKNKKSRGESKNHGYYSENTKEFFHFILVLHSAFSKKRNQYFLQ